jgi:hypothetical protein
VLGAHFLLESVHRCGPLRLVVTPVEGDGVGVQDEEGAEEDDDATAIGPAVHKVAVKNIAVVSGRVPIGLEYGQ